MRRLHWHTDTNPCLLCGLEVTPANWAGPGGVFTFPVYARGMLEALDNTGYPGYWTGFDSGAPGFGFGIHTTFYNGPQNVLQCTRPLFPPLGWAGKSDEELWEAMEGGCGIDLYETPDTDGSVSYHPEYGIRVFASKSFIITDPDGFRLAIRNAGRLHKRLLEEEQEAGAGE